MRFQRTSSIRLHMLCSRLKSPLRLSKPCLSIKYTFYLFRVWFAAYLCTQSSYTKQGRWLRFRLCWCRCQQGSLSTQLRQHYSHIDRSDKL